MFLTEQKHSNSERACATRRLFANILDPLSFILTSLAVLKSGSRAGMPVIDERNNLFGTQEYGCVGARRD